MANEIRKQAERMVTDADKFPIESCRERLARRFGLDAVALSGPCEGKALADCVCAQLESRWGRVKDRFAGDQGKVVKLAMKLAESFSKKDNTEECAKDVQALGYTKEAATGITEYLKAYAMPDAMDDEFSGLMDEVDAEGDEPSLEPELEEEPPMGGEAALPEEGAEDPLAEGDEMVDLEMPGDVVDELEGEDLGGMPPEAEPQETVEIPQDVLTDIVQDLEKLKDAAGDMIQDVGGDLGGDLGGLPPVADEDVVDLAPELPAPEPDAAEPELALEPEAGEAEIPGEPAAAQEPGTQVVKGDEVENADVKIKIEDQPREGESHEGHEGHEGEELHEEGEGRQHRGGEGEKEEEPPMEEKDEEKDMREAAMNLRVGHIRKIGQSIRKLAPEMVLQDSDQLNPVKGKELGTAKEKSVEKPKPVADGNLDTEGYSAGDKKFQDGSTMGREPKFDAKPVNQSDVTGGDKSLMGPDESFPKGGPSVPAGSAPIGGEPWQGGDVSTKGTIIATLTPEGILVEADGKRVLGKVAIKKATKEIKDAIAAIPWDGDIRKFAKAAIQVVRAKTTKSDGVTKVDTSKLESENFTNDAKKAPEKGGAKTEKGAAPKKDDGVTTTDTSKLEKEKFTNDAEKKPEDEPKKASAAKVVVKANIDPEWNHKMEILRQLLESGEVTPDGARRVASQFLSKGDPELVAEVEEIISKSEAGKAQAPAAPAAEAVPAPVEAPAPAMAMASAKKDLKEAKKVEDPKPVEDNMKPEGFMAGDGKIKDGKTMGHEQPCDCKEVNKSDVTGGDKSLMGKDESFPKGGPDVPAGGGKLGNEIWDGGNVSTKGTVIAADAQEQKREGEAKIREARILAASAYAADLLRHGEIGEKEYTETVQKIAELPVQAIQRLALSTRQSRERVSARGAKEAAQPAQRVAGLATPIIISASSNELSLKDRLVSQFKLTRQLDALDEEKEKGK